jgi:hypothetical protein
MSTCSKKQKLLLNENIGKQKTFCDIDGRNNKANYCRTSGSAKALGIHRGLFFL